MNLSQIPAIFVNDVEVNDIPAESDSLGRGCATPPPYALLFPQEEGELHQDATYTPPSYVDLFPPKMEVEEDAVSINSEEYNSETEDDRSRRPSVTSTGSDTSTSSTDSRRHKRIKQGQSQILLMFWIPHLMYQTTISPKKEIIKKL